MGSSARAAGTAYAYRASKAAEINIAIGISVASLVAGWIVYDLICKSPFGNDNTRLMVALYFILVAVAWGYTQLFTGRAAFLHLAGLRQGRNGPLV